MQIAAGSQAARDRARKGALARNSPDGYIRVLERTDLTADQKRRLAALLMPFLGGEDEQPGGAAAGDAA